jgi:ATP-dependent helicase IRC3
LFTYITLIPEHTLHDELVSTITSMLRLSRLLSIPNKNIVLSPVFGVRQYSSLEARHTEEKSIQLRPYQETCLKSCLSALSSPDLSRIGVSLPTGAGKTTVFVSLISKLEPPREYPHASRALIIVNSVELARQAAAQVEAICPGLTVEIDQGQRNKASGRADVYVTY